MENRIPHIFVLAHSLRQTCHRLGLTLFDLPAFIRDRDFAGLEVSDRQIGRFSPAERLRLENECRSCNCQVILDINVDFTAPSEDYLQEEIDHAIEMLRIAAGFPARAVRLCIGGQSLSVQKLFRRHRQSPTASGESPPAPGAPSGPAAMLILEKAVMLLGHHFRRSRSAQIGDLEAKISRAIGALKKILPAAETQNLPMGIENHWGLSGDPRTIIRLIEAIASPRLGTCPDLGNFPRGIDPLAGLKLLAPHAVILHAKSYRFDRDGEEKSIDYRTFLSLFCTAGFSGPITVEYEGLGNDLTGCLKTRDLIRRHG